MPDAILDAVRTPFGRYGGVLATVRPNDHATHVVTAAVERNSLDPASVDELYMCIGVGQGLAADIENPAA